MHSGSSFFSLRYGAAHLPGQLTVGSHPSTSSTSTSPSSLSSPSSCSTTRRLNFINIFACVFIATTRAQTSSTWAWASPCSLLQVHLPSVVFLIPVFDQFLRWSLLLHIQNTYTRVRNATANFVFNTGAEGKRSSRAFTVRL